MLGSCTGMPMTTGPIIYDSLPPTAVPTVPTIPYAPPEAAPAPPPAVVPDRIGFRPAGGTVTGTNARGSVLVRLPADARLYAGDKPLNLTGTERKFITPELPVGQDFTYRFRAEFERDGETISVTKRITVRANATAALEFTDFTTARPSSQPQQLPLSDRAPTIAMATAAAKPAATPGPAATAPATTAPAMDRATIVVQIPAGATLYVDDRKSTSGEAVRSFATPPVPAGKEFAYLMKAEVMRDGRPETLTQKVSFRAGEKITVDFSTLGSAR